MSEYSPYDRGLHYGDGLFETLVVIDGRPLCWPAHWQRLQQGARQLGLPLPNLETLTAQIYEQAQTLRYGVLKLIVTRGCGGRGYLPPTHVQPTHLLLHYPLPRYPLHYWLRGVVMRVAQLRLAQQPALAGHKHLNRLEQVLARSEWDNEYIQEAVLLDTAGYVREGVMTNLFWVHNQTLFTPDLTLCGVAGVIRKLLIQQAPRWGYEVKVGDYLLATLAEAQEVFLTNSVIGIWPVRQVQHWRYPLGAVTRHFTHHLQQEGWIVHYAEIADDLCV
jgi:4-amino-4-deoxychorismate lyase